MSTSVHPSSVTRGASDAVPVVAVMPSSPRVVMVEVAATCRATRRGSDTEVACLSGTRCGCTALLVETDAISRPLGNRSMQDEDNIALAMGQVSELKVQALVSPLPGERGAHTTNPAGRPKEPNRADATTAVAVLDAPIIVEQMTNRSIQEKANAVAQRRASTGEDSGRITRVPGIGEECKRAEFGGAEHAVDAQVDARVSARTVHVVATLAFRHVKGPRVTPAIPVPTLTAATRGDFVKAVHLRTAA